MAGQQNGLPMFWHIMNDQGLYMKNLITKLLNLLFHKFGEFYCRKVSRREYKALPFVPNERIIEYGFVFSSLSQISPHALLDVGTGKGSLPNLLQICGLEVTAIDNFEDYWAKGVFNRHFNVINDDIINTKLEKKFDFITCISVLEHIENFNAAIQSMFSLLNPEGHLLLTFPYNEKKYIDNVYDLPGAGFGKNVSYICQVFSRNEVDHWLKKNSGNIIKQEYWQIYTGEFHTFGDGLYPPLQAEKEEKHQLSCILIQKRRYE